jgi:hypothetical protein
MSKKRPLFRLPRPARFIGVMFAIIALTVLGIAHRDFAQDSPSTIAVVDYSKLLPLLPEPLAGWTAEKAEGSTDDSSGAALSTAHRDYKKGEAENAPITSISILDSAGNPDYVATTVTGWKESSSTPEGYTKSVTIDGNPAYETYENENKHGTLSVMVAKRFLVQIESQGQEAKELQEWAKRVDLKKLAEIK